MAAKFTIELDCPPGGIRPGDLLPEALEGTEIKAEELGKPISMLFGEWTWEIPEKLNDKYAEVQPLVKANVEKLYHAGLIRYGSW